MKTGTHNDAGKGHRIGSSNWRADHQIGGICVEDFGRTFLASDFSGRLHRFDAETGERLFQWDLRIGQLNCVSCNGIHAICGGVQQLIAIDLRTGQVHQPAAIQHPMIEIAVDQLGRFVFSDIEGIIWTGESGSGRVTKLPLCSVGEALSVSWNESDQAFLVAGSDGVAQLRYTAEGWRILNSTHLPGLVDAIASGIKGTVLAVGEGRVIAVNLADGEIETVLSHDAIDSSSSLCLCPDSGMLGVSLNERFLLVDANLHEVLFQSDAYAWVGPATFIASGIAVFGAFPQQLVTLALDAQSVNSSQNRGAKGWINGCAINSERNMITIARGDNMVYSTYQNESNTFSHQVGNFRAIRLAGTFENGELLLSCVCVGMVSLSRLRLEKESSKLVAIGEFPRIEYCSTNGKHIAVCSGDCLVILDVNGNEFCRSEVPFRSICGVSLSSDQVFVTGGIEGVALGCIHDGRLLISKSTKPDSYFFHCVSRRSGSSHFAVDTNQARIAGFESGKVRTLVEDERLSQCTCMRFDLSDRQIVVGTAHGDVLIYNSSSGKLLHETRFSNAVHAVAMTAGRVLVGLGDCTASYFDICEQ